MSDEDVVYIDWEAEADGRYICEVPSVAGLMAYGVDPSEATANTLKLAARIILTEREQVTRWATTAGQLEMRAVEAERRVAELEAALRKALDDHDGYHAHSCETADEVGSTTDKALNGPHGLGGDCDCGDLGARNELRKALAASGAKEGDR